MRIAALSDIHGNLWALEAALADIRRAGADLIVNCGDILSGPLEPSATADLLLSLALPTIAGNHERQLLACAEKPGGPSDRFAFDHTTQAQRDWLRGLPQTLQPADGIFMCHGTPSSDLVYFLEEVDAAGAHLAPPELIERHASGIAHPLILCGHSHLPRVIGASGGRTIVNPGSVGLPAYDDDQPFFHKVENGSPHARYAICTRERGAWTIEQRCVEYPHGEAVAAARRNGREDWARWLATGRA